MEEQLITELKAIYEDNIEDVEILVSLLSGVSDAPEEQRNIFLSDAQNKKDYLLSINDADVLDDVQIIINELRKEYAIRFSGAVGTGTSSVR